MEHNTNHNSMFGDFEQVFQSLLRDLISKSNKDDDAVIGNITKKNCVHLLEEEEPIVIEVVITIECCGLDLPPKIEFKFANNYFNIQMNSLR
jgi:hypothetical protein